MPDLPQAKPMWIGVTASAATRKPTRTKMLEIGSKAAHMVPPQYLWGEEPHIEKDACLGNIFPEHTGSNWNFTAKSL